MRCHAILGDEGDGFVAQGTPCVGEGDSYAEQGGEGEETRHFEWMRLKEEMSNGCEEAKSISLYLVLHGIWYQAFA